MRGGLHVHSFGVVGGCGSNIVNIRVCESHLDLGVLGCCWSHLVVGVIGICGSHFVLEVNIGGWRLWEPYCYQYEFVVTNVCRVLYFLFANMVFSIFKKGFPQFFTRLSIRKHLCAKVFCLSPKYPHFYEGRARPRLIFVFQGKTK